jgi:hypothetical protein
VARSAETSSLTFCRIGLGLRAGAVVTGYEIRPDFAARAQRNHIGLALRAFLRLELYGFTHGVSWAEAKTAIVRQAVRSYLAHPWITLATA